MNEVTTELLCAYINKQFNYEKLWMPYWRNKIKQAYEKIR